VASGEAVGALEVGEGVGTSGVGDGLDCEVGDTSGVAVGDASGVVVGDTSGDAGEFAATGVERRRSGLSLGIGFLNS
jgi:hypothetical protein